MKSVAEKLGVKEGKKILVLHAPIGYRELQGTSPIEEADIIQVFVKSQQEVESFVKTYRNQLKSTCALWMTYPKASPHLGINRDTLSAFLRTYQLESVAICAIDPTWSALRFKAV